jgi:16S rRNA processing protein RimM
VGPGSLEADWVVVGRVRRPVGLRGEVIVEPTGDDPSRFVPGAVLRVGSDGDVERILRSSRPYQGGLFVLQFDGIESLEQADALRGALLSVRAVELPALPEGVYYHYQLEGLDVFDAAGKFLGRLESILPTGSNDVYCVGTGTEEVLIPAIREYVAAIDLKAGRITLAVTRDFLGGNEPPV